MSTKTKVATTTTKKGTVNQHSGKRQKVYKGRIPKSMKLFKLNWSAMPDKVKEAVHKAEVDSNPLRMAIPTVAENKPLENPSYVAKVKDLLYRVTETATGVILLAGINEKYQRNYRADDVFKNNLFATALTKGVIHGVFSIALHVSGMAVWGSIIDGQQRTHTLLSIMNLLADEKEFVFNASKVSDTSFSDRELEFVSMYDGYTFAMLPEEYQERFLELPIHMDIYTGITEEEESALYDRFNGHTNKMEKSESYKAKYCHLAVYQELEKVFMDPKYHILRKDFGSDAKHQAHMTFWEICGCLLYKKNNGEANIVRAANAGKQVPVLFEYFKDPETAPEMHEFVAGIREIMDYIAEYKPNASLNLAAFGAKRGKKTPSKFAMKVMFMYFSEENNRDGDAELFAKGLEKLYASKSFRENFQQMYEGTTGRMWKIRMFADIWSTYIDRMRRGVKSPMAFADLELKTWARWERATKAFQKGQR